MEANIGPKGELKFSKISKGHFKKIYKIMFPLSSIKALKIISPFPRQFQYEQIQIIFFNKILVAYFSALIAHDNCVPRNVKWNKIGMTIM